MESKRRYRVRLRKVYRDCSTGDLTGALPVKSFETFAVTPAKAESNARFRFGHDGQQRAWKSVGWNEQMRVECLECEPIGGKEG